MFSDKYSELSAPLPTIQNNELQITYPLDLTYGGDDVDAFSKKYMAELQHVYKILTSLMSNQPQNIGDMPYAIKIEDNKFYVRNKQNSDWIFVFDILNPEFGNNLVVSNHLQEILDNAQKAQEAAEKSEQAMIDARKATFKISVKIYETITDMKNDADLKAGLNAYVYGATSFNDGKAAFYTIKEMPQTTEADDYEIVKLKEGLYAIRILEQDKYLPLIGGTVTGNITVEGDIKAQNFIGNVTGDITGNAATANNATNDSKGNNINETYVKNITFNQGEITVERGNSNISKFLIDSLQAINFTQSPTVPTPALGDVSQKVANTSFVNSLFNTFGGIVSSTASDNNINIEFANGLCIKFVGNVSLSENETATVKFPEAFKSKVLFVFPLFGYLTSKNNSEFSVTFGVLERKNTLSYIAVGLNK